MTTAVPSDAPAPRWLWLLVLASPVLAVAGMLTHREVFPLLALAILATLVMLPALSRRQTAPWLGWLGLQAALLTVALLGFADLLLDAVPAVINAALAWLFARTLPRARPLIARCIVVVEGEARLHERGVALYARRLTALWAGLLGANALALMLLLLFAERSGVLARFDLAPSWRLNEWWAAAWLNVGGYVLPGMVFVLEYAYRRWRLRHLQHLSLAKMLLRLAVNWPRLLRDQDAAG
ncbi:MAG: xanthomonadin biosynthesis protein [Rhodanobacter sp.]